VTLIIGLAFNHYTGLIDKVTVLEKNNTTLTTAVELQKTDLEEHSEVIDEWEISQDTLVDRMDELRQISIKASKERRRLNGLFSRHDFTHLARTKPGLIERRINTGTAAALRMLECSSGAINKDCPVGDQEAGQTSEPAQSPTN